MLGYSTNKQTNKIIIYLYLIQFVSLSVAFVDKKKNRPVYRVAAQLINLKIYFEKADSGVSLSVEIK